MSGEKDYGRLVAKSMRLIVESLSRRFFKVGSRPDSRDTFLCAASAIASALLHLLHPCSQKKSIQKNGGPDAAFFLRSEGFDEIFWKSWPSRPKTSSIAAAPLRANLAKSSGARCAITGEIRRKIGQIFVFVIFCSDKYLKASYKVRARAIKVKNRKCC